MSNHSSQVFSFLFMLHAWVRPTARRLCSSRRLLRSWPVNEFRHNLATDEWVVFSAARRARPTQYIESPKSAPLSALPAHDKDCPFCKGNEHLTPPATLTRYIGGVSVRAGAEEDWALRCVPNKFPAVSNASSSAAESAPPDDSHAYLSFFTTERVEALGFHEVLIENPAHNVPTALASEQQVEAIVRALRSRGRSMIASDATLRHIMYFKNSGLKAGASLLHPHSQVSR